MLPKKEPIKQLADAASNTIWALSIARTYAIKLRHRYDTYEENYIKIQEKEKKAIKTITKALTETTINTVNELGRLSREIVAIEKALSHDIANAEANYHNLVNTLKTIGNPTDYPEETLGKHVVDAWKTLKEKLKATAENVTTTYNIIRTKLQLENIQRQRELMELERKENQYLGWIQIITGALLINEIIQAILTQNYTTATIVTAVTIALLILMRRTK